MANSLGRDDPRIITETRSGQIRSIFAVHQLSHIIRNIAYDSSTLAIARQILGSDVYIHQSRLNFKPGFGAGPFFWHSDFETWHAEDGMSAPRAVSLSIALTPNYIHNGSLMIMPGTHNTFVPCHDTTPRDHHRTSLQSDIPPAGTPPETVLAELADRHGIRVLTGAAGSGIFFDSNCIHGSNGNITPYPRSNLFIVYNSIDNRLREPYAAAAAGRNTLPTVCRKQEQSMILLISYDLLGPERPQSYEAVHDAIITEAGEKDCVKTLYSQFLVDTTSPVERWDYLMDSLTDADDCWFICEITANRGGTLSVDAVSWLASHS